MQMTLDHPIPAYIPETPNYLGMIEEPIEEDLHQIEFLLSILALVVRMMQRKSL